MDDFAIPEVQQNTQSSTIDAVPSLQSSPQVKTDDVVYSSLLTPGDPLDNYKQAKEEVSRTGSSRLVEDQINQWNQEQLDTQRPDVEAILADPTISPQLRQEVARKYITEGLALRDLRDKYLTKQAAIDTAITEADREAQDIYATNVLQKDAIKKKVEEQRLVEQAGITIKDILKGTGAVGAQIALSIPAGLAGAFTWMTENDPEKANEVIKTIQEYGYNPTEVGAQKVINKIQGFMEFIDIPFKWMGDKTLNITGSPGAATAVYTGTSLVGYLGVYKGLKAVAKGKPKVPEISPLDTATTASKQAGEELAVAAVKDQTETITDGLRTSKTAIINDFFLPKLEEEFGPIKPDARVLLDEQDKILSQTYAETELHPHLSPVSEVLKDRELYYKVLTETTEPHLLLSSSVLGTTEKAFGRSGKGYEALIDTNYNKLEGKAVFGRNQHHGYKTQKGAENYLERLKEQTAHLPEKGNLSVIERDGEFFVNWDFKRTYNTWENLAFGADALSAHVLSPKFDITWLANTPLGDKIWPAYMRMKEWIPSVGATTAWKEADIEGKFITAQRELFRATKHPKDLVAMVRRGEKEGKLYTANDFQTINQHLTKAENEQLHAEYVGFRRIQDHLYRFADRSYRHQLNNEGIKNLYGKDGKLIGLVSEPLSLDKLSDVGKVWDITNNKVIPKSDLTPDSRVVRLKESVRHNNEIFNYAILNPTHQLGEIRAGALTKIPGYVARHYKEWFVLDKVPKELYVDGYKVAANKLRDYSQAVAMGGTRKEINELLERFKSEDSTHEYSVRAEEKRIEDSIIHDSKIYDTYLKEQHKRGDTLPSLNREAEIEDILVSQTRTIQGIAKVTAWDQLQEVTKKQYVKAYGKFTNGEFPKEISDIKPLRRMDSVEEREFLAAQKVYQQWEMQQVQQLPSDVLWKNTLNKVADVFEKIEVDSAILREWGEKGFVPVRALKAIGSNLFLYARFPRMWFVQPQQWKELSLVSPAFAKSLGEIGPIVLGLMARSHTLKPLRSQFDSMGRRAVKDYDATMEALENSGILQAVNMNQMIHGMWRDSLQELDPKSMGIIRDTISKGVDTTGKLISIPFKVGRKLGYDPAELTNQVTLWLFAKNRWIEQNPGKVWNKPENIEQILQLQARLGHMSSTRAGMYSWQDGTMGLITQFAAIPFKSMMQMISAKEFTTSEKAKLAAARLFWYGKYGIPAGAAIYKIIERNIEDPEDKKNLDKYVDGATDWIWNNIVAGLFDASFEKTDVAASKSFSTIPDTIWFWELGDTLLKMAQGQPTDQKFPFMTAGSSLMTAVRGIYDLFTLPPEVGTERDYAEITWKAVSWIAPLSDYSKSQLAEQLTKSGNSFGTTQTTTEAIARLAGVIPERELAMWEGFKDNSKREQYIREDAKKIHQRLMFFVKDKDLSNKEAHDLYLSGMKAFLARVEPGYRDEMIQAILKEDNNSHKTLKESLMKLYYEKARSENDKHLTDLGNAVRKGDEDMQNLYKDIESRRNK